MSFPSANPMGQGRTNLQLVPDKAALTSTLQQASVNSSTPHSAPPHPLVTTFNVSANSPYFYLFFGYLSNSSALTKAALMFSFQMLDGGTPQGGANQTFYCGDPGELSTALAGAQNSVFITPVIGDAQIAVFSPYVEACNLYDLLYSNNGACFRWSGVCNQIQMTTTLLLADADNPFTMMHGVLQQPWG